jgi:8-oxo-dGTP pyrophosphatase MutT (NUDIX family)
MKEGKFSPEEGISYSAGVAYIWKRENDPRLLLVLHKAGEKNIQKTGDIFIEEKIWKMPMGHFNPQTDEDLVAAAHREFQEESGLTFDKSLIDPNLSVSLRISSDRPGARFHEDHFFLIVTGEEPKPVGIKLDDIIEKADFFPLRGLPDGNTEESEGAILSWGHRKKLMKLLVACEEDPRGKEIVENLLNSLGDIKK